MYYSENRIKLVYVSPKIESHLVFNNALSHLGLDLSIRFFFEPHTAIQQLENRERHKPDMIFLETGNGNDCLKNVRQIRALHQFDPISIVLYDSGLQLTDNETAFANGANVYIHRSYDYAGLKKILKHVISIDHQFHTENMNRQTYMLSV